MLRRNPTAIQITAEDVLAYDEEKLRQTLDSESTTEEALQKNEESTRLSPEKKKIIRERRIGITQIFDSSMHPSQGGAAQS
ncbi:Anaphase-promoting complex subunit hcn1 [Schizosaccharomyces pombe]|uniref:Anaphase-promoting complex subunit hcn1 n=2 Tax=Schizosaccharomyces pombe TaxID=4896 RepID=HCN1_SCHPO|nr:anaphase-promoting complex subunit Hcn1 [Schizosaccharomyces pombe]O13916.1 RecName: Full=Anaphase-promoting complex subunit hcn1; AltName: Full=20S cyclosome/APC complex protein hcn1; AltName: Full=Chaperone-like protein hcn1; AltName: Full=High copy suppressor of cut9 protein 1 [Schizosaccharomyces pombe 972h-]BAD34487.1 Hcn1 [Schizosaccharomyces pombe]CAB11170.1 anaphase-promoting complex subunit Hcn1 [Schizosaccharomyces pombe]|eukprot:NP_593643.1 anaphase-promoting complex subunit Hcn1 [Schizosaccharomyces pombe]